jgi:hypothetical protein
MRDATHLLDCAEIISKAALVTAAGMKSQVQAVM